jgi:hypothetical protein
MPFFAAIRKASLAHATNYPLVRITNTATGTITYARTSGMTKMTVAPGVSSSVTFAMPAGTPAVSHRRRPAGHGG